MKRLLPLIAACFIVFQSVGQVSDAYKTEVEAIFQNVNKSLITTGLLSDYGLYLTNIEKFNGVPTDSSYIEMSEWQALYTSLYSCRINTFATLAEPVTVFGEIDAASNAQGNVIVLSGLHYQYNRFKDNAVSSNLVYISDNRIYDTPGRPSSPYEAKDAFAIAPARSVLRGRTHSFMFKPELFYTNTGKTIASVQCDFGDGGGSRTLAANTTVTVNYSTEGAKVLQFQVNYTDGTSARSRTKVEAREFEPIATVARYTGTNIARLNFPLSGFSAPKPYLGQTGQALITVEYTNSDRVIRRPLIIVEGFDPWRILSPNDPAQNFSFEDFINSTGPGGIRVTIGTQTLSDMLQSAGYDVIFIDFTQGTDHIQRNAFVVENVIQWVNSVKQPFNGVRQQNVVVGFSMGGLVARYALRDMEVNSVAHEARLNVSVDSPHQGANVPVGFQAFISHFNGVGIGVGIPGATYQAGNWTLGKIVPEIGRAFQLLNTPAARQMLRYQIAGTGSTLLYDNTTHTSFMNEYRQLGMPQQSIRNLVISNGSECGTSQGFAPYAEFVNVDQTMVTLPWWGTLIANILSPFTLSTSYPQLSIGGMLTTKTDVKVQLVVNALPNQTTQRIYKGRAYVKKKILWVINVNVTLFDKELGSSASFLPIDSQGGGIYDVQQLAPSLPTQLAITRFCFVPTFSSLDIGGGAQSIVYNDLIIPYSTTVSPAAPKNVRANNFFTNPTENGRPNEVHTQLTRRSGQWLFTEIQGSPAAFSCSSACGGVLLPVLSGPAAICYTNVTYTVGNVPPGSTITWSQGSGVVYTSGQGTSSYTVRANSGGVSFIQCVIQDPCGGVNTVRRDVSLDAPTPVIYGPRDVNDHTTVEFYTTIPANSYEWSVTYGIINGGQGTSRLNVKGNCVNSGYMNISLRVTTNCGTSPWNLISVGCYPETGGHFAGARVFPNPVAETLTVDTGTDGEKEIVLRSTFSIVKRIATVNPSVTIDVRTLPKGIYYLIIRDDKQEKSQPIVIE